MRLSKSRLLLILLSFTVLIQNYNPVEGSVVGFGVTAGIGIGLFRFVPRMWRQTGYFFSSIGYLIEVKMKKYKKFSTSDDITDEKYVDINLASVEHGSYITITPQPDDTVYKRKNLLLYEVKAHEHENYPKHLTIGCVRYYVRKLQCNKKYHYRTVLTYVDEMNRKCIQIESFNQAGNRIMKRIFRERNCYWWYDMIIDEKETLIQSLNPLGLFTFGTSTKYSLDLFTSIAPECILKVNFSHGHYYCMKDTRKVGKVTEIMFANQPITPSEDIKDLLIWHYFSQEDNKIITKFVVICELFDTEWSCRYYKCMSHDNREYKAFDSLSVPFDDNVTFNEKDASVRELEKVNLEFDLTKIDFPDNIDNFALHLYPESNHYVLRPRDLNKVYLIKKVMAYDDGGSAKLEHSMHNGFRFATVKTYGDFYLLSYIGLNQIDLLFNTITMKKTSHISREIFYEAGTRASLENLLSPYYMGLTVLDKTIIANSVDLDLNKHDNILTAKLNNNVTFYSSLCHQYVLFKKIKMGSDVFDLSLDLNSQVFYYESQNTRFAVVTHANKKPTIIKHDGTRFVLAEISEIQGLLSESKLSDILNFNLNEKWEDLILNLNDVYISEGIEVSVPTSNTAVFRTCYGRRISKIFWNKTEIDIKEGWPLISKIKYFDYDLLLIDTVHKDKIHRELYKLRIDSKPVLMANKSIHFSKEQLDPLAKELSNSMHDLYPNNLPVKVYFEDAKTDISQFDLDGLSIAHSNSDLVFTPGDISVHGFDYKVLENHKWKQVFRYKGQNELEFYSIFTLAREGIYYYFRSAGKEERKKFLRDSYKEITGKTIPLLVDSICMKGVKTEVINVGKKKITKFRSEDNSSVLNPIVFGRHEIRILGEIKKTEVFKSFDENNICSFSIEVQFENSDKQSLTFTQTSVNSDKYKINGDTKVEFDDGLVDLFEHAKDQSDQNTLDFNQGKYPLDLRYMILNDKYFYFTGFTKRDNFSIVFGEETHIIDKKDTRYNIWVRYAYENVTTCAFFMSYRDGSKLKTKSQVHDNQDSTHKIEKPKVSFNWGILSNLEATVVNRYLLSMAAHVEEFFPMDLKIDDTTVSNAILELKIDNSTSVYTTVSSSKCVINNVIFKNAVIKGVPKQLLKQVFRSKVGDENAVVVVTKTVSKVMVNAYVFKDNTFLMVDVNSISCGKHKGLKQFKMCA